MKIENDRNVQEYAINNIIYIYIYTCNGLLNVIHRKECQYCTSIPCTMLVK